MMTNSNVLPIETLNEGWRMVGKILKKSCGRNFKRGTSSFGGVLKGIIVSSDLKFINNAKKILEELKIDFSVGDKGHGSGGHNTIQVVVSKFTEENIKHIRKMVSPPVIVGNDGKPMITGGEKPPVQLTPSVQPEEQGKISSSVSTFTPSSEKNRRSLSQFLCSVFRFENIVLKRSFRYEKKEKGDGHQTLTLDFSNEELAQRAEMALGWLLGAKSVVVREGTKIAADCGRWEGLYREKTEGKKFNIFFRFPPPPNSQARDIALRLKSVHKGSRPKVTIIKSSEGTRFAVLYRGSKFAGKMLDALKEMGWLVKPNPNNPRSLVVEIGRQEDQEHKLPITPLSPISPKEKDLSGLADLILGGLSHEELEKKLLELYSLASPTVQTEVKKEVEEHFHKNPAVLIQEILRKLKN